LLAGGPGNADVVDRDLGSTDSFGTVSDHLVIDDEFGRGGLGGDRYFGFTHGGRRYRVR